MNDDTTRAQLYQLLVKAPKPQLHIHLDGSLSFRFIKKSIERMQINDPQRLKRLLPNGLQPRNEAELRDWLMEMKQVRIQSEAAVEKNCNWKVFDFCNQFLQTEEDLYYATYELVTDLSEHHNVNYVEIRFAPVLHTLLNLTEEDAVKAAVHGFNSATVYLASAGKRVSGGIILCALRSFPTTSAEETLKIIKKVDGVLGFDIAGEEKTYPLSLFENVLRSAKDLGIKTTVHAGEGADHLTLCNLSLALDIGVDRIGHGIALRSGSNEILTAYSKKNMPVEVCLTSNCGNPSKCKSFSEHPVTFMLKKNIRVSAFNCDNLLLSGSKTTGAPDPTNECVRALLDCSIDPTNFLKIIKNGYDAGFNEDARLICEESMRSWENNYFPKLLSIISKPNTL